MNAVRETVARVDPSVPITNLQHDGAAIPRRIIAIERFVAGASTAFAVLATALAALGLYGVLAYSVAQRSREIGLRIALGAPAGRIRGMVLRQVARMAVIGVVLGAIAAAGSSAVRHRAFCSASRPGTRSCSPRPPWCSRPSCSARPTFRPGARRASIR